MKRKQRILEEFTDKHGSMFEGRRVNVRTHRYDFGCGGGGGNDQPSLNVSEWVSHGRVRYTAIILSDEERMWFENEDIPDSPLLIQNHLFEWDADAVAESIGCQGDTVRAIQTFLQPRIANAILYDLLQRTYDSFVDKQRRTTMVGDYDQHIHQHVFKDMLGKGGLRYTKDDVRRRILRIDEPDEAFTIYWVTEMVCKID